MAGFPSRLAFGAHRPRSLAVTPIQASVPAPEQPDADTPAPEAPGRWQMRSRPLVRTSANSVYQKCQHKKVLLV